MSQHFPDLIDPRRCCDLGKRFTGQIALSEFPRLGELLADAKGEASFELKFGKDGPRRQAIRGWVRASLHLECQRCRGLLEYPVESSICLTPVEGLEEVELLPEEYDPLLLESPTLKLAQLLEDELLLSLPQVPMHETGSCQAPDTDSDIGGQDTATTENPFAALAELKRNH